jgi:hypothetical protein
VSEAEDETARETRLIELARQKGLRLRKSQRGKYMLIKVERVFGHSARGAFSVRQAGDVSPARQYDRDSDAYVELLEKGLEAVEREEQATGGPRRRLTPKEGRPMTDVTGRDGYIIAQALAFYIAVQDALPGKQHHHSDQCDAFALLLQSYSGGAVFVLGEAQAAVEHLLWSAQRLEDTTDYTTNAFLKERWTRAAQRIQRYWQEIRVEREADDEPPAA